jgi:cyclopropane fatty-acyl-phospholipid synthase-like methyltransferase
MRVSEMLGKVDGLNLLDVGCGPGKISTYILENRGDTSGLTFPRTCSINAEFSRVDVQETGISPL